MVFCDNTDNGKCSKCGMCCGSLLPLTEKDIKRVKYIVQTKDIKPQRPKVAAAVGFDLMCPFLTTERKCIIYNHRPAICRHFKCDKRGVMDEQEQKALAGVVPYDMWSFFDGK